MPAAVIDCEPIFFTAQGKQSSRDADYVAHVMNATGMTEDEYRAMMLAGGRSPDGVRSIKDGN